MRKKVLDIANFLFDEKEFKQVIKFLDNKDYSGLIEMVEEEKEMTNILSSFEDNDELKLKFNKLQDMSRLIINEYAGINNI